MSILIAGMNYQTCKDYARVQLGLKTNEWRYVRHSEDIRGMRKCCLILTYGWYTGDTKVLQIAEYCGITIIKHGD